MNTTSHLSTRAKNTLGYRLFTYLCIVCSIVTLYSTPFTTYAVITPSFETFSARPPIHVSAVTQTPQGLTPTIIKSVYHLPASGGIGTIAIIDAYHNPDIESDLAGFDTQFSLSACTVHNKCLSVHKMSTTTRSNADWSLETALDLEWAHAIAPNAHILLVEAESSRGTHLMDAIDYARNRADIVAISMSWGGNEFKNETALDSHFISKPTHPIVFTASSGDDGTGASWPAVSPYVIAVGGTTLNLDEHKHFVSEKAWNGSGGGISMYEPEPTYQKNYSIPNAHSKRASPDVSYVADPRTGFAVYHNGSWFVIGGTSAGAPQWAGIASLSYETKQPLSLEKLYTDKARTDSEAFFRDIVSGKNGSCTYYCSAHKRYDYVTGLGSPQTYIF